MKKIMLMSCLSVLFVNSCSLYTKPDVPSGHTPQQFKSFKHTMKASYHSPIQEKWWQSFNDKELNNLVATSFKNNYGYQIAVKNIDIARTYISQYQSMRWPQLNLNGNLSRNHSMNIFNNPSNFNGTNGTNSGFLGQGSIYNLAQLFASVSYELDVWNQVGNTVNQAVADTAANSENSKVVKLTLINSVVDSYFQIATLNVNIANLREQKHVAEEILRLTAVQFRSGLIDASGLEDARNQVETIKAGLAALQKQKEVTSYTLAYLLGEYPEKFSVRVNNSLRNARYERLIPPALPSQMLTERPDIQQAIYQVLSAGYIEKQNYANFFPSFALTGSYGYASTVLSNLLAYQNSFWNYGLNAMQPLFDYKLRSSEYQRAKLQYENSILNYKNVVLNAFKEVDSALSSYQQDTTTLLSYKQTLKNNHSKLAIANSQYQGGLTDYSSLLTTRLVYLQSSYNVNTQKLAVMEDVLQVYKTLGVGL